MNKRTIALTQEEYVKVILTIREGFLYKGEDGKEHHFTPKEWLAMVCMLEANLGMRIGDILKLKLSSFIRDSRGIADMQYRLDVVEEKTGKLRSFTVPNEVYYRISDYVMEHRGGNRNARIFDRRERVVQKNLAIVFKYLGMEGYGTHSFRKFYGTEIYYANGCNIELVRILLQQSSTSVTKRYLLIQDSEIENAIRGHVKML